MGWTIKKMGNPLPQQVMERLFNRALIDIAKSRLVNLGFLEPSLSHACSYLSSLKNWSAIKDPVEAMRVRETWEHLEHDAGLLMYTRTNGERKDIHVERG